MHFNNSHNELFKDSWSIEKSIEDNNDDDVNLIAIDTIKIDDHLRFTFTKRVRKYFKVEPDDTIAVFTTKQNNNDNDNILTFKVQRKNHVVQTWTVKRKDMNYIENSSSDALLHDAKFKNQIASTMIADNTVSMQSKFHISNPLYHYEQSKVRSPNVMIVDDDKDINLTFKIFLLDKGINAETFVNPLEAVRRFAEVKPDYFNLVITDIKMPQISGLQLYNILKIMNKDVNVLFVSAMEAAEELINMLPGIKSSDIIKKPVSQEHFINTLKPFLFCN